PVVGGEGEEGQRADAEIPRGLDRPANGLDARRVARRAGPPPGDRPAAVAVHDDRHVQAWLRGLAESRGGRWSETEGRAHRGSFPALSAIPAVLALRGFLSRASTSRRPRSRAILGASQSFQVFPIRRSGALFSSALTHRASAAVAA